MSGAELVPAATVAACGSFCALLTLRLAARPARALAMLGVLAAFFAVFATLVPSAAAETNWRGALLLFGSAAVFKLMNRFES
jgi:hypothetical protein